MVILEVLIIYFYYFTFSLHILICKVVSDKENTHKKPANPPPPSLLITLKRNSVYRELDFDEFRQVHWHTELDF